MVNISYQQQKVRWLGYVSKVFAASAIICLLISLVNDLLYVLSVKYSSHFPVGANKTVAPFFLPLALIFIGGWIGIVGYSIALDWSINTLLKNEKARDYDGPFYLLLRPFSKTQIYQGTLLTRELEPRTQFEITRSHRLYSEDLILKIEAAVHNKAMLVTVGGPKYLHILCLKSDPNLWSKDVELLARHARTIFLLPETSEGMLTEIELLRDHGLTQKAVIIMPPLGPSECVAFGTTGTVKLGVNIPEWERLRHELAGMHYQLPRGAESGMMFTLNPDLSSNHSVALRETEQDWGIANALEHLQPDLNCPWLPMREIYPQIEESLPRLSFGFMAVWSRNTVGLFFMLLLIFLGIVFLLLSTSSSVKAQLK